MSDTDAGGTPAIGEAGDDSGMEPDPETLQAEYAEIEAEQERLLRRKLEIADLLAPLGLHDHTHGAGLYTDPYRDHAHVFTDPEHTHEPRQA